MLKVINSNCLDVLPEVFAEVENGIIVTDPPFNIGYHYRKHNDSMPDVEYWNMLTSVFSYAPFVCVLYPELLHQLSIQLNRAPDRVVSWVYTSNTMKQHRDAGYYGIKPDLSREKQPYKDMNDPRIKELYKRTGGARIYDWLQINQVKNRNKNKGQDNKTAHPCQMPVEVMERLIGVIPGEFTVIDPFCGSGTTGVACANKGIDFIGIDVDEVYCDIAAKRIEEASNRVEQSRMEL